MVRNWALVIGINQYDFLEPLKYAKRDAQLMRDFLCDETGFERVFFLSDDSPDISGKSTRPYRANLLRVLQQLSEKSFMEVGDNFWFFFNGYGIQHNERDYLMPSDGNPNEIEHTAISIDYVTQCLRCCGSDNIVLILNAHNNKSWQGIGLQTQEIARQTGTISIFSCSPYEYSYEIDALQQGAFTYALLEGLSVKGQCATVKRLNQYLNLRVPELVHHYNKNAQQTPYSIAEPVNKSHVILIPQNASLHDIATLKIDAFEAEINKDFELAEQLWMRVNAASNQDMDALQAIQRIAQLRVESYYLNPNLTRQLLEQICNGRYTSSVLLEEVQDIVRSKLEISKTLTQDFGLERRADYKRLQDFLAAGQWKEADRETVAIMLKIRDREKQGWLNIESINKFPCHALYTIDQLWLKYSNGHFGYSVQKRIWENVGGKPDADYETWCKFCESIGWRMNGNWLFYLDLNFTTNAPQGHFPASGVVNMLTAWQGWVVGSFCCSVGFSALVSKLENCGIPKFC